MIVMTVTIKMMMIVPNVPILVASDGQWQGGVGEDSIDGAHGLARHRVGAGVQSDDGGPGLGLVDDAGRRVEADHQVAQVTSHPVNARAISTNQKQEYLILSNQNSLSWRFEFQSQSMTLFTWLELPPPPHKAWQ